MESLLCDIELPLVRVLADMELIAHRNILQIGSSRGYSACSGDSLVVVGVYLSCHGVYGGWQCGQVGSVEFFQCSEFHDFAYNRVFGNQFFQYILACGILSCLGFFRL